MLAYLSLILHTIISMLNSTYGSKGTSCKWIHFQLDDDGGVDDGGITDSCLSLNQLLLSHQHGSIIMITKNQTKSTVMWKIKSRILHNETSDCASSFYLCVCLVDDAKRRRRRRQTKNSNESRHQKHTAQKVMNVVGNCKLLSFEFVAKNNFIKDRNRTEWKCKKKKIHMKEFGLHIYMKWEKHQIINLKAK